MKKFEMCEGLFYSWLKHVKSCQVVHANWKISSQWTPHNQEQLGMLMADVDVYFCAEHKDSILKKNRSIRQLLRSGESDVIGIRIEEHRMHAYAVDVENLEAGLFGNQGDRLKQILKRCARHAFCLLGYLDLHAGEIIFAAPTIQPDLRDDLEKGFAALNNIFNRNGVDFTFGLITGEDFDREILQSLLRTGVDVTDIAGCAPRRHTILPVSVVNFAPGATRRKKPAKAPAVAESTEDCPVNAEDYPTLKVGQLALRVLGRKLREGAASKDEVAAMQTKGYSKEQFHILYPLLVKEGTPYDKSRYYTILHTIDGVRYRLCSQWFEQPTNNDRPYLLRWIENHR